MTIKACVFDMDGTLLNTLEDLALCANATLEDHDYPTHPTQAYRHFVGSGARNLIIRALPEPARQDTVIDACLQQFKVRYDQHWDQHTHLYEGVASALDDVSQAGLPMAILTNKPQAFAKLCVDRYLNQWSWQIVQGQQEGLPIKPAKGSSDPVTAALAVPAEQVLYFGDSDVDMHTANNAGYRAVGVSWGFRSERELINSGADHIIHSPNDIKALL